MNTTQYYKHGNFLVVQTEKFNDTFDLNSKKFRNEFFNLIEYLEHFNYSEHSLQRVSNLLVRHFKYNVLSNKDSYGYTECIIPNNKLAIELSTIISSNFLEEKDQITFYKKVNNDSYFPISQLHNQKEFRKTNNYAIIDTNQYCTLLFGLGKEEQSKLNQISNSLNILSKYDAN
jgi:hypothetical protein